MKFDFNDYKDQIENHAKLILTTSEELFEEAVNTFGVLVRQATPIGRPELWQSAPPADYTPGQLRAGWEIAFYNDRKQATVSNKVPYAVVIEYGSWSTQAPQGMMRITQKRWPIIINNLASRKKL